MCAVAASAPAVLGGVETRADENPTDALTKASELACFYFSFPNLHEGREQHATLGFS